MLPPFLFTTKLPIFVFDGTWIETARGDKFQIGTIAASDDSVLYQVRKLGESKPNDIKSSWWINRKYDSVVSDMNADAEALADTTRAKTVYTKRIAEPIVQTSLTDAEQWDDVFGIASTLSLNAILDASAVPGAVVLSADGILPQALPGVASKWLLRWGVPSTLIASTDIQDSGSSVVVLYAPQGSSLTGPDPAFFVVSNQTVLNQEKLRKAGFPLPPDASISPGSIKIWEDHSSAALRYGVIKTLCGFWNTERWDVKTRSYTRAPEIDTSQGASIFPSPHAVRLVNPRNPAYLAIWNQQIAPVGNLYFLLAKSTNGLYGYSNTALFTFEAYRCDTAKKVDSILSAVASYLGRGTSKSALMHSLSQWLHAEREKRRAAGHVVDQPEAGDGSEAPASALVSTTSLAAK